MTFRELERKLLPIDTLAQLSLSGIKDLVKEFLAKPHTCEEMSHWQSILSQSKANGGFYHGEALPQTNWKWPENTWFQERLTQHQKFLDITAHHARN